MLKKRAAISAETGTVKIHAHKIFAAIPHFKLEKLVVTAPTPMIAVAIVCVVDTGIPPQVAKNRVKAPPDSAEKPPTGFNLVIFMPMVFTILQPPNAVPRLIAK